MRDFATEKEAAARRCPYSFAACDGVATGAMATSSKPMGVVSGGSAGVAFIHAPVNCIASNCMAWRWSHQDNGPVADPTGFCGAFGLPKYI